MTVENWIIQGIIIHSLSYGGGGCWVIQTAPSVGMDSGQYLQIMDDCSLLLNGVPTTKAEIVEWVPRTKDAKVSVDRDYEHGYGHIKEARFS